MGDGVEEGPDRFLGMQVAPADDQIVDGAAGSDDRGDQTFGIGENGAVLAKRLEMEIDEHFAGHLLDAEVEEIESGGIGVEDFADGTAGDYANVEIFDKGAEALFTPAQGVNGGPLFGDVTDDHQSAAAAIEIEKGAGHLAGAKQAGFGLKSELDVADLLTFAEVGEDLRAAGGFGPKV